MVCHKDKAQSTRNRNAFGELSCKEIYHRYGKNSKYERDNSEVSFRVRKGIKEVGEKKEQRKMRISGVALVKSYLVREPEP